MGSTVGKSVAQRNREVRQESLRELLASQGHLQHLIEDIEEMHQLGSADRINRLIEELEDTDKVKMHLIGDEFRLKVLKEVADKRIKLINKYLPDARDIEAADKAPQGVVMVLNYTGIKDEEKIIEGEEVDE